MAEKTEGFDHMHEARQWLDAADREASTDANAKTPPIPLAEAFAAVAQVHASLAIAEQLERLNRQLERAGEPTRILGAVNPDA